ncbi:MAG: SH3 domain-containing protein [Chloroflexota bacterium]
MSSPDAWAEIPKGQPVTVINTGAEGLTLREGTSRSSATVVTVPDGTELRTDGPDVFIEGIRWISVTEPGGKSGWAPAENLSGVSTGRPSGPVPVTTELPPPPPPTPPPPGGDSAPGPSVPGAAPPPPATATPVPPPPAPAPSAPPPPPAVSEVVPIGSPIDLEARVKYPESDERMQTVTVTVMRDGKPVAGAYLFVITQDTDPPVVRTLDPTDEEGRVARSFDMRKERGTVRLVIVGVAPDGGRGYTSVSYFRR